ncbi:MAG: Spy/CpxP family protein refolding chaperone, partial [Stellaceae bacterium]
PAAAPAQSPAPGAQDHGLSLSRRTDGRIAYMKAALRITPQQEPRWNKVAQALRENAHEADAARASFRAQRGQPQSAVEALQARGRFVALKAKQNDRLLAAFEPLYRSLSPEQKQAADQLLVPHHHHHHHHMI